MKLTTKIYIGATLFLLLITIITLWNRSSDLNLSEKPFFDKSIATPYFEQMLKEKYETFTTQSLHVEDGNLGYDSYNYFLEEGDDEDVDIVFTLRGSGLEYSQSTSSVFTSEFDDDIKPRAPIALYLDFTTAFIRSLVNDYEWARRIYVVIHDRIGTPTIPLKDEWAFIYGDDRLLEVSDDVVPIVFVPYSDLLELGAYKEISFNLNLVESKIDTIKGLSDRFLYINGQTLAMNDIPRSVSKTVLDSARFTALDEPFYLDDTDKKLHENTYDLLEDKGFQTYNTFIFSRAPVMINRDVFSEMKKVFNTEISRHLFRNEHDFLPILLYQYYVINKAEKTVDEDFFSDYDKNGNKLIEGSELEGLCNYIQLDCSEIYSLSQGQMFEYYHILSRLRIRETDLKYRYGIQLLPNIKIYTSNTKLDDTDLEDFYFFADDFLTVTNTRNVVKRILQTIPRCKAEYDIHQQHNTYGYTIAFIFGFLAPLVCFLATRNINQKKKWRPNEKATLI